MAIDFDQLRRLLLDSKLLSRNERDLFLSDDEDAADDALSEAITEQAESVLSLGWDGTAPGGSGMLWISKWKELYFFGYSDHDREGPFPTLEEALSLECFYTATYEPEVSSSQVPLERLLKLGKGLVSEEGDEISINDVVYVLRSGELVKAT